jgi:hypothetical protein
MGFRTGAYAKVWSVTDNGNYSTANVSISRKDKDSGEYKVEFQDGYVRLVGNAHTYAKEHGWADGISEKGETIQISSCDVTNYYDTNKQKLFTNFVIFGFDIPDGNNGTETKNTKAKSTKSKTTKSKTKAKTKDDDFEEVEGDDDDLPF